MTYQQTTYVPKQTNHLLHLVLTLITCGLWAPVWLCVALYNSYARDKHVTVGGAQPPFPMPGYGQPFPTGGPPPPWGGPGSPPALPTNLPAPLPPQAPPYGSTQNPSV